MSAQRARSTFAAENRSAHPNIPGVPWWGAVVIAAAATLAGFAIDAATGHRELTLPFAALYALGCVAAVLAVRQSGVFTAVVQPPLILFIAVPSAYFLFHRAEIRGIKDVLINCGYPLVERFLLMFTTSVVVLLIGMARWYFGAADRAVKATPTTAGAVTAGGAGLVAGIGAKVTAMLNRQSADDEDDYEADEQAARRAARPRKHTIDRPAARAKPRRERRATNPAAPSRSRHARPPMDDHDGPPPAPRRRYSRDVDADGPAPPPRRRRTSPEPGMRTPPRERDRREYRQPDWEPEPPRPRRSGRYESTYEPYEPYDAYEPPERYNAPPPPPSTHNPFSNVRYRGREDANADDNADDSGYRRPRG